MLGCSVFGFRQILKRKVFCPDVLFCYRAIVDTIDRRNLEGTEEKFEKVMFVSYRNLSTSEIPFFF